MPRPRLLQVCNVGRIVGGTAACAWTVTRALTGFDHYVCFLSPPDQETLAAFRPAEVSFRLTVTKRDIEQIRPDVLLLHNTASNRIPKLPIAPALQYLHSVIPNPAPANITLCCSHWLAQRIGLSEENVLWQAVPRCPAFGQPWFRDSSPNKPMVVGRICTPLTRKWPAEIVPFYAELARRFPPVRWEFAGCPESLQPALKVACRQQAVFFAAGWKQRALLHRWGVLLYSNPRLPESFGRTVAEAMRIGCIPVVDRQGGFIEQIPPGAGLLCNGVDEFSAALDRLSDPELRCRMSARAQSEANRSFSLERFANDLLRWFDRAV